MRADLREWQTVPSVRRQDGWEHMLSRQAGWQQYVFAQLNMMGMAFTSRAPIVPSQIVQDLPTLMGPVPLRRPARIPCRIG